MDHVTRVGYPIEGKKIFLEDYVYTYLKKQPDTERKKYYLYGKKELQGKEECLYVYGICDSAREEGKYFNDYLLLGTMKIKETEKLLLTKQGEEIKLTGFYVFYAPNQGMQEYLIDHGKQSREEEELREEQRKRKERRSLKQGFERNITGKEVGRGGQGGLAVLAGFFFLMLFMAVAVTGGNGYEQLFGLKQMIISVMADFGEETTELVVEEQTAAGSFVGNQLLVENENVLGEKESSDEQTGEETLSSLTPVESVEDEPDPIGQQEGQTKDGQEAEPAGAEQEKGEPLETQVSQEEESTEAVQEEVLQKKEEGIEEVQEESQEKEAERDESYDTYIVQKGDTLVGICQRHYGGTTKLKEICQYNGIKNEDHIAPGQKLYLP